jgi:signal transduction histidine kinase
LRAPAFVPRFLSRLRGPGPQHDDPRIERVLAFSRLGLVLIALGAWQVQPDVRGFHEQIGLLVLLAYVSHTLVLLWLVLRWRGLPVSRFVVWEQISDISWPALLCLFTDPPNSIFFLLFLFAIFAAAFRWGFSETMLTAELSAAIPLLETLVITFGPAEFRKVLITGVESPRLVMRCGFLLITGFLLGFLAETEKELRAEIALTNRLLSLARTGTRLATAFHEVLSELGRVFCSGQIYEVVAQSSTGRVFKWHVSASPTVQARAQEIEPRGRAAALMQGYPHTFYMDRRGKNQRTSLVALDEEGQRLDSRELGALEMPVRGAGSVLVISHELGHDWSGRCVVVNARLGRRSEHELSFAQDILRQIGPALYSVYLSRRFRSRAGAIERARVARELHDTAIQSLISIEMQVDVLRRSANGDSRLAVELHRIQDLLRQEVLNLRELMQSMRPLDIGPHQFLDFIAQLVERFSRETGLAVRFVSDLSEVSLPATSCRELARIVQEGLVNIRKHSGAHSAMVRFASQNGSWKLVIDDDGKGFPFSGRFTLHDLEEYRRGPAVITERVRAVGGDMVIESTPGHGARLEITIPQKGHEYYG